MKDVLIFLPGTMGSCLRLPAAGLHQERKLWHENPADSLSQLVGNPSLYKRSLDSAIEPYDILTHVTTLFVKRDIYGAFRTALQSLDAYHYEDFPYDWRQDLRVTAKRLAKWLQHQYQFSMDAEGIQLQERRPRLHLVGHSMGGLVAALAMKTGYIHPGNVRNFITIGTPFYGSPAAFKALYDVGYLSGMRWLDRALNWRKDRRKCRQVLLEALQSFCSIYQLLPPISEKFVELEDGRTVNPLDMPVVEAEMCDKAYELQEELASFTELLRRWPSIQHHFIYGDYPDNTEKLYTARVAPTGKGFDSVKCYKSTHGDGTVPVSSSSVKTSPTALAPIVGASHMLMCADRRVIDLVLAYLSATGKSAATGI